MPILNQQPDQGSTPRERRAPVRSYHVAKDARRLRELLAEIDGNLRGIVDDVARRKVRLVVAELVALLVTKDGVDQRVRLDVQVKPDAVRLDSWDAAERLSEGFWRELGESVVVFLADTWGLDRRRQSGAWFEVKRTNDSTQLDD